jgi:hypothetical protein
MPLFPGARKRKKQPNGRLKRPEKAVLCLSSGAIASQVRRDSRRSPSAKIGVMPQLEIFPI